MWVEHPDIASKIGSLGVQANEAGKGSPYTLPTISLPDQTPVMDSAVIAPALENLQPEPGLHLETGLQDQAQQVLGQMVFPLLPIIMPLIARNIIPEKHLDYWLEKRRLTFGMPLDEFERQKGGEQAWKAAEPGFAALKEFLTKHKRDQGPFVLGSQVSYADFVVAAMLESARRLSQETYERFMSYDESFRQLHAACGKWLEKDQ